MEPKTATPTAPSAPLLQLAHALGINPDRYNHVALREVIDARTADLKAVMGFKKAHGEAQGFETDQQQEQLDREQQQKELQLQQRAQVNRATFAKAIRRTK